MPLYEPPDVGLNLSTLVQNLDARFQALISLQASATEPTVKPQGTLWFDTASSMIKLHDGVVFRDLLNVSGSVSPIIVADGRTAMSGDLDLGGNKIANAGAGTLPTDLARRDQAVLLDGSGAMTGNLNLNNRKAIGSAAPTDAGDLANKQYVDDAVGDAKFDVQTLTDRAAALTPDDEVAAPSDEGVMVVLDVEASGTLGLLVQVKTASGPWTTLVTIPVGDRRPVTFPVPKGGRYRVDNQSGGSGGTIHHATEFSS